MHLKPGEGETVVFSLAPFQLAFVDKDGVRTVEPGKYIIGIGGSQVPAVSATVKIAERIIDPPYVHNSLILK